MSSNVLRDIPADTQKGKAILEAMWAAGRMVVASAAQVTAGKVTLKTPRHLGTPLLMVGAVYSTAGVVKAWDGAMVWNNTTKEVELNNAGTTDFVAGDKVVLKAYW